MDHAGPPAQRVEAIVVLGHQRDRIGVDLGLDPVDHITVGLVLPGDGNQGAGGVFEFVLLDQITVGLVAIDHAASGQHRPIHLVQPAVGVVVVCDLVVGVRILRRPDPEAEIPAWGGTPSPIPLTGAG